MATQASGAPAKGATSTTSPGSRPRLLREDAPALRTAEDILKTNEQIKDGMVRGVLSPKIAEQLGQCCKVPIMLVRLELSYLKMLQAFGRKAPVPRSPLIRSLTGLDPNKIAPTDGKTVRALIGEGD